MTRAQVVPRAVRAGGGGWLDGLLMQRPPTDPPTDLRSGRLVYRPTDWFIDRLLRAWDQPSQFTTLVFVFRSENRPAPCGGCLIRLVFGFLFDNRSKQWRRCDLWSPKSDPGIPDVAFGPLQLGFLALTPEWV